MKGTTNSEKKFEAGRKGLPSSPAPVVNGYQLSMKADSRMVPGRNHPAAKSSGCSKLYPIRQLGSEMAMLRSNALRMSDLAE